MCNAFVLDGRQWVWSQSIFKRVEGGGDETILFIKDGKNSLFNGVFILLVSDLTYPTTCLEVTHSIVIPI